MLNSSLLRQLPAGRAILLLAAIVFLAGLMYRQSLFEYWTMDVLTDAGLWLLGCTLLMPVLAVFRIRHKWAVLCACILVYLAGGAGWGASLVAACFAVSAFCLGRVMLYLGLPTQRAPLLLMESLLLGGGAYLAVFGVMLHFPVNHVAGHVLILAVPIVLAHLLRLPAQYRQPASAAWRHLFEVAARANALLLFALVVLTGYVARFVLFPSVTYDDHALHLRMWTVLAERHVYDFDVRSQIWAVAPFAVDLLHASLSLVAQADARAALNLALLAFLLYAFWRLAGVFVRRVNDRLLLSLLFVSTPMLSILLISLQTELMLAVLATCGSVLLFDKRVALGSAGGAAMLMVAALCAATKLPGAVLGAILLAAFAALAWRQGRLRVPAAQLPLLLCVTLLATVVALHSYAYAWHVTGNPLFPLYNAYFKSPLFGPYNFLDLRYVHGVSLSSWLGVFFHTSAFYESKNYVAGFQYLFLLPLALLSLLACRRQRRGLRILAPLCGFGFIMFLAVQYWRYLFPVMPLASAVTGALFYRARQRARGGQILGQPVVAVTLLAFTIANLYFLPGISWNFETPAGSLYGEQQKLRFLEQRTPEYLFNLQLNRDDPGARVLFASNRPAGATLSGTPVYINWYAPAVQVRVEAIASSAQLSAFLKEQQIRYVYWNLAEPIDAQKTFSSLLAAYLSQHGVPLQLKANMVMYRLQEMPVNYASVVDISDFRPFGAEAAKRGSRLAPDGTLLVSTLSFAVQDFPTGAAQSARYAVKLACPNKNGSLIAQINWSQGPPYYRLVHCNRDIIEMAESVPVPPGAERGVLFLTSRDTDYLQVRQVSVSLR